MAKCNQLTSLSFKGLNDAIRNIKRVVYRPYVVAFKKADSNEDNAKIDECEQFDSITPSTVRDI